MANETYAERNAGKLKLYRITSQVSKHIRTERIDGKLLPITYGFGSRGERNEILLTEEGAKALSNLGLKPVASAVAKTADVDVPADWESLSLAEKCAIADKINTARKHKTHGACEKTIKAYLGIED